MSRLFALSIVVCLLSGVFPQAAHATPLEDEPLCLPGPYRIDADCLPYGSWSYLNYLSELGITLPLQPLAASSPDAALSTLPFYYARVTTPNAPVFASLEAAVAGQPVHHALEPGLVYVTYQDYAEVGGKNYYMIDIGLWMRRGDITPNQAYSQLRGLEFTETPDHAFGWVIEFSGSLAAPFQARQAPGINGPMASQFYNAYEVVQIYQIREADGLRWYMVGPDQWLESSQARLVLPNVTPPEGVDSDRWIEINLEQQTIAVYQDGKLTFATLIATGLPGVWTRPGLFQIYEKHESTLMRGVFTADRSDYYFLEDVPWTMYFDEARALHGAYWRARFGFEQSHGCVNLSVADSHWLFNWGQIGDWVYVHDPSGRTPTDDSQYGEGGA